MTLHLTTRGMKILIPQDLCSYAPINGTVPLRFRHTPYRLRLCVSPIPQFSVPHFQDSGESGLMVVTIAGKSSLAEKYNPEVKQ